jgi:hypothetical protein
MSNPPRFGLFSNLPLELREQIWSEVLGAALPRIFRFSFRYPKRASWSHGSIVADIDARPGDQYFLQPHCTLLSSTLDECYERLQTLKHGTVQQRVLSRTCADARAVVTARFPYMVRWRLMTQYWMEFAGDSRSVEAAFVNVYDDPGFAGCPGSADAAACPEHTLRFGPSDIFVFDAFPHMMESVLAVNKLPTEIPLRAELSQIRHVGIYDNCLGISKIHSTGVYEGPASWRPYGCACDTLACEDHCQREMLPAFLAMFPRLEAYYIVALRTPAYQRFDFPQLKASMTNWPARSVVCPCVEPRRQKGLELLAAGRSPEAIERKMPQEHWWPTALPTDFPGVCVIFDETEFCWLYRAATELMALRTSRGTCYPQFRALDHLKMHFVRMNDWRKCVEA